MPRVQPKKRFSDDQIVRAWQGFSYDDSDGVPHTVRRGTCLRGDDPAVLRAPWCFVPAHTPVGEEPSPLAFAPPPVSMFAEPTKLRVTSRVHSILYGPHRFTPGQEFTADATTAERLVADGHAEVVE